MTEYWKDRQAAVFQSLQNETAAEINKRMAKYYVQAEQHCINAIENLYFKLPEDATVNDLYKLDKYWQMEAQIQEELTRLGNNTNAALDKGFINHFNKVSNVVGAQLKTSFATIDKTVVRALVEEPWCADGLSYSARIWNNMALLKTTLDEELSKCVITGSSTISLTKVLEQRFGVARYNASRVARAEIAHVQNKAAQMRYKEAGVTQLEFYATEDERECEECGAMHGKIFSIDEDNIAPLHPFCRCTLLPVLE
jgi:SPP1 gp7 family putative phage head morphogenesis protein